MPVVFGELSNFNYEIKGAKYLDENGVWQKTDFNFDNTGSITKNWFKTKVNGNNIEISKDGSSFSFSIDSIPVVKNKIKMVKALKAGTNVKSKGKVSITNFNDFFDAQYEVTDDQVKESLYFTKKPDLQNGDTLTIDYKISLKQLDIEKIDEELYFKKSDGSIFGKLRQPYIIDRNLTVYRLNYIVSGNKVSVTIPASVMLSMEYPVILDPTYDDFNDNNLNTSKWKYLTIKSGGVTETSGQLRIYEIGVEPLNTRSYAKAGSKKDFKTVKNVTFYAEIWAKNCQCVSTCTASACLAINTNLSEINITDVNEFYCVSMGGNVGTCSTNQGVVTRPMQKYAFKNDMVARRLMFYNSTGFVMNISYLATENISIGGFVTTYSYNGGTEDAYTYFENITYFDSGVASGTNVQNCIINTTVAVPNSGIKINCNLTGNYNISKKVWVEIKNATNIRRNISLTNLSKKVWNTVYTYTGKRGYYNITNAYVNDTLGRKNSTYIGLRFLINSPIPIPQLSSPTNKSQLLSKTQIFSWTDSETLSQYTFQIANTTSFSINNVNANTSSTSYTVTPLIYSFPDKVVQYWRVSGNDGFNTSKWSNVYQFMYNSSLASSLIKYSNFTSNQNSTFPQVNDRIRVSTNVTSTYYLKNCSLFVNGGNGYKNIYSKVFTSTHIARLNSSYIINWSDSNPFVWKASCYDNATNFVESDIQYITINDFHLPVITIGNKNVFDPVNLKVLSINNYPMVINLSMYDPSLRWMTINVTCGTSGQIYYNYTIATSPTINHYSSTAVGSYPLQQCRAYITSYGIGGIPSAFISNYIFYFGGIVNFTARNIYDNSLVSNYSIRVRNDNAYPGDNRTYTITSTNNKIMNLSPGLYYFDIHKNGYMNQTLHIDVSQKFQNQNVSLYQGVLNFIVRNVKTGNPISGVNISIYQQPNNKRSFLSNPGSFSSFFVNASYPTPTNYKYSIIRAGYSPLNGTTNITGGQNKTIDVTLPFFTTFKLIDEVTLNPFNISSPDTITFLVFCPEQTIQTIINSSTQRIPISCDYKTYKFVLQYGATSYYRSFIYPPTGENETTQKIYLPDQATTQILLTSFRADDLLNDYDNVRIYVKKIINTSTEQITADYVDIEGKITAFLVESHQYIIEIWSDNRPVKVIGSYSADIAGDKILRLYDINAYPTASSFTTSVGYYMYYDNATQMAHAVYNDPSNQTTRVTWTLWADHYNDTLITSMDIYASSFDATYNLSGYQNRTIYGSMRMYYTGGSTHDYNRMLITFLRNNFPILQYVSTDFTSWFILIVIGTIAMMATIRTSSVVSLILVGLAGLMRMFGLFVPHNGGVGALVTAAGFIAVIAIAGMVSLISLFKEGSTR